MQEVRVLEKRRIFDDIFAIDEAVVSFRRPDGAWSGPVRRLSFERGDSVAALLVNRATGRLVLVDQFRYPTWEKGPGRLREIVAGGLEEGETPEAAVRREVREETGHDPVTLHPILTFYVSPGGRGVGDEDIRVVERAAEELWQDLAAGRLQDAKTIIALLWLRTRDPGPV
jgi:ADP-ribose pyrophosphatase